MKTEVKFLYLKNLSVYGMLIKKNKKKYVNGRVSNQRIFVLGVGVLTMC